jgi:uncharacterized membrane protein
MTGQGAWKIPDCQLKKESSVPENEYLASVRYLKLLTMHATLQKPRVESVDILRGIVMIIMALDHVRDFWSATPFRPEDLTQTSTALFFTRWVTHLCAPVFAFLSGVSIYLQLQKQHSKVRLTVALLKRGIVLILLQVFFLSFMMQLAFDLILLEVIWVLGWSMILMAGLIWLPRWVSATIAFIVIAGHNLLPSIQVTDGPTFLLAVLHNAPTAVPVEGFPVILIAYTIIPWAAVMAAGFVAGKWFLLPPQLERYTFFNTSLTLLLVFAVVRYFNVYGDPIPWTSQERGDWYTFLSFINVTKYPPSLLFLCLMMGVAFLLLWIISLAKEYFPEFIKVYGRVPFFYFIVHMAVAVVGSVVWMYLKFGVWINLGFTQPDRYPPGYEPSLIRAYVVWIAIVALLYFPCKWFGKYKARRGGWTYYL